MQLDILVVAPHPDDAELGMGGAIVKFKAEGFRVGILDLTNGEPTPHGSVELRATETAAASQLLQLDWRENLGLPNRRLEATLEARHQLSSRSASCSPARGCSPLTGLTRIPITSPPHNS